MKPRTDGHYEPNPPCFSSRSSFVRRSGKRQNHGRKEIDWGEEGRRKEEKSNELYSEIRRFFQASSEMIFARINPYGRHGNRSAWLVHLRRPKSRKPAGPTNGRMDPWGAVLMADGPRVPALREGWTANLAVLSFAKNPCVCGINWINGNVYILHLCIRISPSFILRSSAWTALDSTESNRSKCIHEPLFTKLSTKLFRSSFRYLSKLLSFRV